MKTIKTKYFLIKRQTEKFDDSSFYENLSFASFDSWKFEPEENCVQVVCSARDAKLLKVVNTFFSSPEIICVENTV